MSVTSEAMWSRIRPLVERSVMVLENVKIGARNVGAWFVRACRPRTEILDVPSLDIGNPAARTKKWTCWNTMARSDFFVLENSIAQAIRRRDKGWSTLPCCRQHGKAAAFHLATASCTFGREADVIDHGAFVGPLDGALPWQVQDHDDAGNLTYCNGAPCMLAAVPPMPTKILLYGLESAELRCKCPWSRGVVRGMVARRAIPAARFDASHNVMNALRDPPECSPLMALCGKLAPHELGNSRFVARAPVAYSAAMAWAGGDDNSARQFDSASPRDRAAPQFARGDGIGGLRAGI